MQWRRRATAILGWTAIAVSSLALLARFVGLSWQPAIVLAAFSPNVAVVSAVVAELLLSARRGWAGPVVSTTLIALTVAVQAPLFVSADRHARHANLTVLQANVKIGAADPVAILDRVRSNRVDVLTVEELTAAELTRLTRAGLDQLLPFRFVTTYPGGAGTGIWSRYPLVDQVRHDDFSFEVLSTRAVVPGAGPTTVWAVHVLPPWPYPARIWVREMSRLRTLVDQAAAAGESVVASGDFNSGLDNQQFRRLLGDTFADAAEQSGSGWQPTYPTDRFFPPVLTLDHVLVHSAVSVSARTVSLPGSDHRGLLTRIALPAAGSGSPRQ